MKPSKKTPRISGLDLVYGTTIPFIFSAAFLLVLTRNTEVIPRDQFNVVFELMAAVFFFAHGIATNIHFQNAARPSKQIRFMRRQGSFFLVVGMLFATYWTVNIYVAIGLMLIASSFLIRLHSSILLFCAVAIALISGWIYYIQSDFVVSLLPYADGFHMWNSMLSFLLYNGYYAFVPWYLFELMGILFCRGTLYKRNSSVYVLGFLLLGAGFLIHYLTESFLGQDQLIMHKSNVIPGPSLHLPAFLVSGLGLSLIVIQLVAFVNKHFKDKNVVLFFSRMGKMKYSLLLAQMMVGGILMFLFGEELFRKPTNLIIICLLYILLAGYAAKWWLEKHKLGPVEKLFRKISGK